MECSICLSPITENQYMTNCNHIFCSKCLELWREIKNNCPMCRRMISYTIKINVQQPNLEKRITRSMTKQKRETEFYEKFKELVFLFSDSVNPSNMHYKTQIINKIVKLCLKNYSLMPPTIYNLVLEILNSDDFHIKNRTIIKKRLIELKNNINYDSVIDI